MSGTAKRLAEAANQIVNPQPIAEAKQLGTVAPFNYNMELLKAMSADEDGKVKFAVSGFMLRVYGKSASSDLVNFFKKVLNDAGKQYKIVAQSRFDVQYVSPKDTSGIFQKGFEGITVNTGNIIASNKELLDRFGKSVYDAVRKQFPSNSVQVGGAYDGAISGGFNYGKGLGFSGVDLARSMSPKGSMMGEDVQIAEAFKNGDKVKVPHKGKMVSGRIIRYDDGGTSKAQQHGGGYVVDVGEPASIFVTKEKIQKEAAEQIDELSKKKADAEIKKAKEAEERARINYEADVDKIYDKMVKIFKQKNPRQWSLADELGGNPTVRQDAIEAADKGSAAREYRKAQETLKNVLAKYKQNMQKEAVVTEAEWKSLKKTKVDLNALRQQGYKISVQHGEGDTLYKITGKPSKPVKKEAVEEAASPTGGKKPSNPFNPTLGDLLKSKQQAEIDAKIRKVNAADAVERIKEIINSYSHDKQTKGMIIAGMKSIKESAEITEAPYTPANDYEGEMAMTQLKSIMEKASDVLGMMKPEAKMEAWVQSKITLADEHISCVRDYLKHTDGAIG